MWRESELNENVKDASNQSSIGAGGGGGKGGEKSQIFGRFCKRVPRVLSRFAHTTCPL